MGREIEKEFKLKGSAALVELIGGALSCLLVGYGRQQPHGNQPTKKTSGQGSKEMKLKTKIVSGMNEMTNEFHFCFDGINENEMNERNESE